ncbi:YceI family protein [Catenovulum sediminis]|uniref:YceI family protein n=1 Tax=Catenovulum sediminis TaxID=1740262 RepID=A0ABV1RLK6_9ALTE
MKFIKYLLTGVLLACSNQLLAAWTLDNTASGLNFLSVKKSQIVESHRFKNLSGFIDAQGNSSVSIDLASVETNIPIRNERMQQYLFETSKFQTAVVSLKLPDGLLASLQTGTLKTLELDAKLDLHGQQQTIKTQVSVVKTQGKQLFVTSLQPVLINAADYSLIEGINKLQELAGLPSITYVVPVTFNLTFNAE